MVALAVDLVLDLFGRIGIAWPLAESELVSKERIPTQAADMLSWHARNDENDALDHDALRRYWRMVEGGNPLRRQRNRYGKRVKLEGDELRQLADGLRESYDAAVRSGEIADI